MGKSIDDFEPSEYAGLNEAIEKLGIDPISGGTFVNGQFLSISAVPFTDLGMAARNGYHL